MLRLRRLLVPVIFGILVIVPPQVYMERLTQGFNGNFFNFYPSIFSTGAYPKGNLSWHHMWFIAYLFVYDVIFAPVFKWSMSDAGKNRLAFFNQLAKGKRIYLLTIPSVILFTSMTLKFPETHDLVNDWCRLFYWLFFLLAGFACINFPSLMNSLQRNRRASFSIAVVSLFIINYLRWNKLEPDDVFVNWQQDWRTYLYIALYPVTAWFWVFTGIGYGKQYLNKKLRVLDYLNQAVYPFFILHQTVIVIITYYVVQTSDTILVKYLFTVILSFMVCMSVYHLFIRPFAITRFLFGMKKDKKKEKFSSEEIKTIQQETGVHLKLSQQI